MGATTAYWVLVDDGIGDRQVLRHLRVSSGSDAVCLRYPRFRDDARSRLALGAGTLLALLYVHAHTGASFAVKLDTDALIIGPFADTLARIVREAPEAGVIGTLGDSCHPDRREPLKLDRTPSLLRFLRLLPPPPEALDAPDAIVEVEGFGPVTVAELRAFAVVRPHIEQAVAHGYRRLQYCQGGAYVVTRACIDRMANAGYFEQTAAWNGVAAGTGGRARAADEW